MAVADPAVDVQALGAELARRAAEASSGRAAQAVHGGGGAALSHTVLALRGGRELADHESPGDATLQVLTGHVRLVSARVEREGRTGQLVAVPDERHRLEALEDSVVLLTVAKR